MDPIIIAIGNLARAGINVTRAEFPFGELYEAPGYPELTRFQVYSLSRLRGIPASCPILIL